jgi:hypothetical protein
MKKICIFFLIGFLSFASYGQSSRWLQTNANDSTGDQIAGTISTDGKSYLASRCFREFKKCAILISAPTKCDKDAEYPMLINSDDGSEHAVGICRFNENKYEYILTPYSTILKIINKESGIIGIALPLESGEFRAYRFSLLGAKKALNEMHAKFNQGSARDSYKF